MAMETITARNILDVYARTFSRHSAQQGPAAALAAQLVRDGSTDMHAAGEAMDYLFSLGRGELGQSVVEKTLDALMRGKG